MTAGSVYRHLAITVMSGFLVLFSLSVPTTVRDEADMKAVKLGYPFWFVTQDFSRLDPPSWPRQYSFGSPWEDPFQVSLSRVALSYFAVFMVLQGIEIAVKKIGSFLR